MSYISEQYPNKIKVIRGTQNRIYLEFLDSNTKLPINFAGSTFSAVILDQEDSDAVILATYSEGSGYSISSNTCTLDFTIDSEITALIYDTNAYLRIYHYDTNNVKNLLIYGNVLITN